LERYQQQQVYIRRICELYETSPSDYSQLVDLLQQVRCAARQLCCVPVARFGCSSGLAVWFLQVALLGGCGSQLSLRLSPASFARLQMQQCGQPPQEIVDELAPGMQV